ncbi:MAG: transposase [Flavobacteriales bacterium]|jgi:transposase
MNKDTNYYGIDISKDVFDVMDEKGVHHQFKNNHLGYRKFLKYLDNNSHCVMEATGYYHYKLAYYLLENKILVSVENPLSVKRFIQMKLSKIKTDKSDAKMICEYARNVKLRLWVGQSKDQQECLQMTRLLSIYTKQSTALKNKLHGEEVLGTPSIVVVRSIKRSLKSIQREMKLIEEKLLILVKNEHQELLTLVESIPGIGRKTGMMLLILTDGFERFNTASELCSYAGITPVIRQSGSSVRGQARISKIGNPKLRNLLFLCSFNACKYNKACKALYDLIVAKGKSKKLALLAVCNKLLKQAFAVAKSRIPYDENYRSTLMIN